MALTPDVPGVNTPLVIEQQRVVAWQGKQAKQLLVISGTAPYSTLPFIPSTSKYIFVEPEQFSGTYQQKANLLVVNSYPPDIVMGQENFQNTGDPEPPFIQPWKVNFNSIDRSYTPYVYSQDVFMFLGPKKHFFQDQELFVVQRNINWLSTNLTIVPIPPSDVTFRARYPVVFIEPELFPKPMTSAWFVPMMPGLDIPIVPSTPFAGAGVTQGYFTANTTMGYFN